MEEQVVSGATFEVIEKFYPVTLEFSQSDIESRERRCEPLYELQEGFDGFIPDFPVILQGDGHPWALANQYLISVAQKLTPKYNPKTVRQIAIGLVQYRRFLEKNNLDPLNFNVPERRRPLARFVRHLQDLVDNGKIAGSTANNRKSAVQNFYRGIVSNGILDKALIEKGIILEERERYHFTISSLGKISRFRFNETNHKIRYFRGNTEEPGVIMDGGKRIPLLPIHQVQLFEELKNHNHAYFLIFLFSLYTGARLQTVLTLRIKYLKNYLCNNDGYALISYGNGSEIDGKHNKSGILYVPVWLVENLLVYTKSPIASSRRGKSYYGDCDENYVFLTKSGDPYYTSNKEITDRINEDMDSRVVSQRASTSVNKEGEAIGVFIRNTLRPALEAKYGYFPHFSFHDIRATFGINLIENIYTAIDKANLIRREKGQSLLLYEDALREVMKRMNHNNDETTRKYVTFRDRTEWRKQMIDSYEESLLGRIDLDKTKDIVLNNCLAHINYLADKFSGMEYE